MSFVDISIEGETDPFPCPVNLPVDDAVKAIRGAYDLRAGRIDQSIADQWVAMVSGNIILGRTYRFKGGKPASQPQASRVESEMQVSERRRENWSRVGHEVLPLEEIQFDSDQHTREVTVLVDGVVRRGFLLGYHVYMAMIIRNEIVLSRYTSLGGLINFVPTGEQTPQFCVLCQEDEKACGNYCEFCNNFFMCDSCKPEFIATQLSRRDMDVGNWDAQSQKKHPVIMQCPVCMECAHLLPSRLKGKIDIEFGGANIENENDFNG